VALIEAAGTLVSAQRWDTGMVTVQPVTSDRPTIPATLPGLPANGLRIIRATPPLHATPQSFRLKKRCCPNFAFAQVGMVGFPPAESAQIPISRKEFL
jgi:hypothetical protein